MRWAYWLVLAGACATVLALNWPGHFSWDSVSALHEGRFHVRETWNPAIYGWLLGVVDRITPNAAGMVALSAAILFGSWAALALLRPRASWLAPIVALAAAALPQVLIYPAIVWKDILFAETTIAGFVVLALGARRAGERTPWAALVAASVLFAVAGLLRQNGLILAGAAAVALLWVGRRAGARRSFAVAGGWLVAVAALTLVFSATLRPQGIGAPDNAGQKGLRLLWTYDVVAAMALQPGRPMPIVDKAEPAAVQVIHTRAVPVYTPERVDTITFNPDVVAAFKAVPRDQIRQEWVALVTHDPGLYLQARAAAFRQVFTTPVIDHCLPVHLGVEGPAEILKSLNMPFRDDRRDERLYNYVTWFLDTPAMSHVPYAIVALLAAGFLLIRRDPADIVVAALLAGALAFTASFFLISIACDYRYLYLLDLAALTGVLYLALDPRLRRS